MKFLISIFKIVIKIIYLFFKLLPINKKKVVMFSRQSNTIPLDFSLLKKEILDIDHNYKVVIKCKKLEKSTLGKIKYFGTILNQMYHLATARVCIVDSYCIPVSVLKHKKDLIIIQIWHAIGTVKKFGYQTINKKYGHEKFLTDKLCMHKNYDYIISGSYAMAPIFAETFNVNIDKIKCIGTPKIDYLLNNELKVKKQILKKYPDLKLKKNILYAPTFRKDKKINISKIIKNIDLDKYNLIVKTHPVKKQNFKDNAVYNCEEFSTLDLLTIADYVITDYSAISIEASIINKPVYFYIYDISDYEHKNGLNIDIIKEMRGCCFKNFKQLYRHLDSANYNYRQLQDYKNKYVSNLNGNSGYILANFIVNNEWIDIN